MAAKQALPLTPSGHIPQPDCLVLAACRQCAAIRGKGSLLHFVVVAGQSTDRLPGGKIPDLDDALMVSCHQEFVIRRDGGAEQSTVMGLERSDADAQAPLEPIPLK